MSRTRYEKSGAIAELVLDRPEKLNAIDSEMLREMDAALDDARADDSVRVLLLRGEGRAFSAGFDLGSGIDDPELGGEEALRAELRRDFDFIMRFWDFPKPIVAAVHGYCLGSSMEISAVCDITIAAEGCRFGAPEVRYGSGVICMILPWIVGLKHARELLLTGTDKVDAKRAEAIGLVNRVVPQDELLTTAREMANEIALNDHVAVCLTKKAISQSIEAAGLRQALENALDIDFEIEKTETPESKEFYRIMEEQGAKAAFRWRAEQLENRKTGSLQ